MATTLSTGFILFDLFLLIVGALLAIYVYFKHSYQYWKNKKIPYLEPTFPYGNSPYILPKSSTYAGEVKRWHEQLKKAGHKFGGVWSFSRSTLVLVDPDYIKDILSKDFQYFIDRDFYCNEKSDPLGTHLFNIGSHGWKPLRQKLTPTFTSGKMKLMLESVLKCTDGMIDYLDKSSNTGDDIDIREVLACFTTDVIGSVAFGIDCNSFDNTHAEFRHQGKEIFRVNLSFYLRTLLTKNFPDLSRKLGLKSNNMGPKLFMANMVKQTMEYRKKNNINRNDFLQLLINMNEEIKDKERNITFEQIVANSILFFIAGFDTSSTTMTFTCFELACNPDIQEKLRREITEVLKKHDGKITYEALKEMIYLEQVMDETMRLFPPVVTLARICTKDYQLRDSDAIIEKGTPVVISPLALGRDPEYFPDPERFDPERFNAENKATRHPFIHLPFGEGPRNCIGLRFGVMQSKIGIIRILTKFRLTLSPTTKIPIEIDESRLLLKEKETLYLRTEKI